MPRQILVLTGELEAERLAPALQASAPLGVTCSAVSTSQQLHECAERGLKDIRLISFCTRVVVPASVLNALSLEAYNIHPGSPEFPGLYPEAFAIYEGAARFGATAHVMAEQVDTGAIVQTRWFNVPKSWRREDLAGRVYENALELFFEITLKCMTSNAPLPRNAETWSGNRCTRTRYQSLCERTGDPDEDNRRHLAFAPDYPGPPRPGNSPLR